MLFLLAHLYGVILVPRGDWRVQTPSLLCLCLLLRPLCCLCVVVSRHGGKWHTFCPPTFHRPPATCRGGWEMQFGCVPKRKRKQIGFGEYVAFSVTESVAASLTGCEDPVGTPSPINEHLFVFPKQDSTRKL